MIRIARNLQIGVGLALTCLLMSGLRQNCGAKHEEDDTSKPPSVIVVPPTGYKPSPVTSTSEKGGQYFNDLNCSACHSIHSVGGDLAPVLDGIGQRRNEEFLYAHLSNSPDAAKKYSELIGQNLNTLMPHQRFSPETAHLLVAFLLTLPEPPGGFVIVPHTTRLPAQETKIDENYQPANKTAASEDGSRLYEKLGCVACHQIGQVGGWLGPSLDGIGGRRSREYIVAHITDAQVHARQVSPAAYFVPSEMPRFSVSDEQVQKIADYLMTLPNPRQAAPR